MPTPSKFTAERRARILELLRAGASRRTAAAVAGLDHQTLGRWIQRGKTATEGSRWAEFYAQVGEAEAHPRMRALQAVHDAMPDNPLLAFRYLERREPGYAPTMPQAPSPPAGPIVIQLTLPGSPRAFPEGERPNDEGQDA